MCAIGADAKPIAINVVCNDRKRHDVSEYKTRTQCSQIEYCANSHKKNSTHILSTHRENRRRTKKKYTHFDDPCEEDTEVKMPKNEIKSTNV